MVKRNCDGRSAQFLLCPCDSRPFIPSLRGFDIFRLLVLPKGLLATTLSLENATFVKAITKTECINLDSLRATASA